MFNPSIIISPSFTSYNLSIRLATVVFPLPDSPINANFLPASKLKFILFKISVFSSKDNKN